MKKTFNHFRKEKQSQVQSDTGTSQNSYKKHNNSKRQQPSSSERVNILSIIKVLHSTQHPLKVEEILKKLRLAKSNIPSLENTLQLLQQQGQVSCVKGEKWIEASGQEYIGTFVVQRSGASFVIIEQQEKTKAQSDIFIPADFQNGAWDKDRVRVALLPPNRRGKTSEGRVIEIIERRRKEVIVRVTNKIVSEGRVCLSVDPKLDVVFIVDVSQLIQPPFENDILLIIPHQDSTKGIFTGVAQYNLGAEENVYVQEQIVKVTYAIPQVFPRDVLEKKKCIEKLFEQNKGYFSNFFDKHNHNTISQISTITRQDLRSIDFVTIDGEDAKDFDDAICVYPDTDGWVLWVAIADVSHFVTVDSSLDREALARGNSYYFPTSVEPMLPEFLSNNICSLKPYEERLVMAVKIFIDKKGIINDAILFPGVISSRARLTYEQVQLALDNKEVTIVQNSSTLSMLQNAAFLAQTLQTSRFARGSLEFDIPEPRFLIDTTTKHVTGVIRQERLFSHQIIEECMLTANEVVATFLYNKQIPFLYRVHPEPDPERLEKLFRTLAITDLAQKLPVIPDAKKLKVILEQSEQTPQAFLISRMVLRSMMQAKYSPELGEHFGLASPRYCHFTSPIRRYADLLVHRALKVALGDQHESISIGEELNSIAEQCNTRERVAQDAEREIAKRLSCLILQGREGDTFEAIVTGVTDFGFFVELIPMPIEGMIRLSALKYDWFEYNQDRQELRGVRTGQRFYLGQRLEVILISVTILRLEIIFKPTENNRLEVKNSKKDRDSKRQDEQRKRKSKLFLAEKKDRVKRKTATSNKHKKFHK